MSRRRYSSPTRELERDFLSDSEDGESDVSFNSRIVKSFHKLYTNNLMFNFFRNGILGCFYNYPGRFER